MSRIVLCSQNMSVPRDPRVWREALALAGAGHDVTVVCPMGSGLPRRERRDGIDIIRYRAPSGLQGSVGLAIETLNALVRTTIAVIKLRLGGPLHVLHAANPPDTFFLVALLLRPFGTKFIFDQHDLCPELFRAQGGQGSLERVLRFLEQWSYRTADLVVSPNNSYCQVALSRGRVPDERVVVVRSGCSREPLPGPDPDPDGTLHVAYAGVIGAQDGVELLLEAIAEADRQRPGAVVLEVIGDGDAVGGLRARCGDLGIDGIVRWAGWLDGDEYTARLASASVAVSPDANNAFNRLSTMAKVIDYVSLGQACVAADLPETRETAGSAAVYFAPGSSGALAEAIVDLIDHPEKLDLLREQARARSPLLRWEHGAIRLVSAYASLLGAADRRPCGQQVVGENAANTTG